MKRAEQRDTAKCVSFLPGCRAESDSFKRTFPFVRVKPPFRFRDGRARARV